MTQPSFARVLEQEGLPTLRRARLETVQVNVTKRCNLACHHCHVESSPKRTESMEQRTAERIVALLDRSSGVRCLDLTGGAPEMWPHFRELVAQGRSRGLEVIDRCNLTIFYEEGYGDLPAFMADLGVTVVASLPCYTKENVDGQRGRGVFDGSIEALRWLNRLGYGRPDSGLTLDLVYNPVGPALPPDQAGLEADYRRELSELFGIEFNRLYALANMPIKRWADWLRRRGQYEAYMSLLVNHFNPDTVANVMCRDLVSIAYDGQLYDCDFNQQLELAIGNKPRSVWDVDSFDALAREPIAVGTHCFGCTAGTGSSCGGALV